MASTTAARAPLVRGSILLARLIRPVSTAGSIPSLTRNTHTDTSTVDCPELPDKPSWSLSSIMEHRDSVTDKNKDDITPESILHLINLAHLHKPSDPKILHELERDVRRMRNFLDYIQSCDTQGISSAADCSKPLENLRSLVDDGVGLRLRPTPTTSTESSGEQERQGAERRDMLLERPARVKGNFFVVGAELDPKVEN
ncbi:hypothetical protein BGZ95_009971 [Linnemannia exigua]|uniref:Glutamyl-tRNA(Gln) amidotransferase subunit F, mitochondrial n=1 Tax=Linnemannia exigua TaxID=604196 RepID=A0AAD4DMK0_9FUNG|nr:hypothetical protein BGZ95_009971 [Linnemannia exigua]